MFLCAIKKANCLHCTAEEVERLKIRPFEVARANLLNASLAYAFIDETGKRVTTIKHATAWPSVNDAVDSIVQATQTACAEGAVLLYLVRNLTQDNTALMLMGLHDRFDSPMLSFESVSEASFRTGCSDTGTIGVHTVSAKIKHAISSWAVASPEPRPQPRPQPQPQPLPQPELQTLRITLSGPRGAGKTGILHMIKAALQCHGIKVLIPADEASEEKSPDFQCKTIEALALRSQQGRLEVILSTRTTH